MPTSQMSEASLTSSMSAIKKKKKTVTSLGAWLPILIVFMISGASNTLIAAWMGKDSLKSPTESGGKKQ